MKALSHDQSVVEMVAHQDNLQVAALSLDEMLNYQLAQTTENSPDKKSTHSLKNAEHNPSVRFLCLISEREELLQLNPELLDRNYKNMLQDCNMQFTLIYRDHLQGNAYITKTLQAPSFIDGNLWDICFFCSPHAIETNFISRQREPTPTELFSYY